jgi:hypothetical protein
MPASGLLLGHVFCRMPLLETFEPRGLFLGRHGLGLKEA